MLANVTVLDARKQQVVCRAARAIDIGEKKVEASAHDALLRHVPSAY